MLLSFSPPSSRGALLLILIIDESIPVPVSLRARSCSNKFYRVFWFTFSILLFVNFALDLDSAGNNENFITEYLRSRNLRPAFFLPSLQPALLKSKFRFRCGGLQCNGMIRIFPPETPQRSGSLLTFPSHFAPLGRLGRVVLFPLNVLTRAAEIRDTPDTE